MWEYKVIGRRTSREDVERALNSYAREGWEYSNIVTDEAFGIKTCLIILKRLVDDSSEKPADMPLLEQDLETRPGRPVPPSRRSNSSGN